MFSLKIVIIIDEIDLHPCTLDRCNFNNKRMIGIVNYQVHTGKPDHFVKLVSSFVNTAISRHESTYLLSPLLYALG